MDKFTATEAKEALLREQSAFTYAVEFITSLWTIAS